MTYIAQEQSVHSASPVELYDFSYGNQTWRYTSGDADYYDTLSSRNYSPIVITRGNIEYSGDLTKGGLEIGLAYDTEFLDLFRVSMPSDVVSVTIRSVHRTDTAQEIVVIWKGRILNVDWQTVEVRLACEPIRSSVERFGLRRLFQISCPHMLYSTACGVNRELYDLTGTVSAITGTTISLGGVSAFAADYFSGGYIEYTNSTLGTVERRMIRSHPGSSDSVVLVSPVVGLTIGGTAKLFPGCDHSISTCSSKFNNVNNYGGFPYTPFKNPFGGELIY